MRCWGWSGDRGGSKIRFKNNIQTRTGPRSTVSNRLLASSPGATRLLAQWLPRAGGRQDVECVNAARGATCALRRARWSMKWVHLHLRPRRRLARALLVSKLASSAPVFLVFVRGTSGVRHGKPLGQLGGGDVVGCPMWGGKRRYIDRGKAVGSLLGNGPLP
ncbi:Protein of unknown function [Gryllus bimaculatus]|nr:Protein of unknown function [Gryllus bimaculatus]